MSETNLERYVRLARELSLGEIRPSKIVGTGYKSSVVAREVAFEYLTRMIAIEVELLRESEVA